ncbi:hypothetical protein ACFOHS_18310 [Jhaorihella thermophila]
MGFMADTAFERVIDGETGNDVQQGSSGDRAHDLRAASGRSAARFFKAIWDRGRTGKGRRVRRRT